MLKASLFKMWPWMAVNVGQCKFVKTFLKHYEVSGFFFFSIQFISYCWCMLCVAQDNSFNVAQGSQDIGHPWPKGLGFNIADQVMKR